MIKKTKQINDERRMDKMCYTKTFSTYITLKILEFYTVYFIINIETPGLGW